MRNMVGLKDCLAEAYVNSPTAVAGAEPVVPLHRDLPVLTTQVYPCHEVVKMDYFIPGCPPSADAIFDVLDDLINGRPVDLPKSLNLFD
jgi:NAD-reducing hydrogenase small subunit